MSDTAQEQDKFFSDLGRSSVVTSEQSGLIYSAYLFAKSFFREEIHKSGLPFITHCIKLAELLRDLEVDPEVLAVAFLHDLPKHTNVSYEEIARQFGENISGLVKGSQCLSTLRSGSTEEMWEDLEGVLVEMSRDIRIAIIRLVHRLYDLENNIWKSRDEARQMVEETFDIYIPIAKRLGLGIIKERLEDMAFKTLHPTIYKELEKKVARIRDEDEACLTLLIKAINGILETANIKAKIWGRLKTLYSIYSKMVRHKKRMEDVLDTIGLRIIVDDVNTCYRVVGYIHTNFTPIPKTFDDYIGASKPNNYQSLHTCIYPVKNITYKPVEIQIRTHDMHEVAEFGAAAHWKYKDGQHLVANTDEQLFWIRSLLSMKKKSPNRGDFIRNLKESVSKNFIIAFDENGKVYRLPQNSSPLYFAKLKGIFEEDESKIKAKINGRFRDVKEELHDGDTVEICM